MRSTVRTLRVARGRRNHLRGEQSQMHNFGEHSALRYSETSIDWSLCLVRPAGDATAQRTLRQE